MTQTIDTQKENSNKTFNWLHFSDIHVGQNGQNTLWPRASKLLLDDLETAHKKTGGFDCLIFSGDLAQSGSASEFEEFDDVLHKILKRLGDLGETPPVITVPGNHDLSRPGKLDPYGMALSKFWSTPDLQEGMWGKKSEFLKFLKNETFKSYEKWRENSIEKGIHLKPLSRGIIPGDASYRINLDFGEIGLVGLNSTWLQLGAGDYTGQLHVDTKQLLAVTENDPDEWIKGNQINILVTHQPASWLKKTSPSTWDADINPVGRFDLHLFGHMHEPDITNISHGGGLSRRNVQAASLFGLENYGDGHVRIQGYSANSIQIKEPAREFKHWPRRLISISGGGIKLAPDSSQDIDEDTGGLSISYALNRPGINSVQKENQEAPKEIIAVDSQLVSRNFDLASISYSISASPAHQKVRRAEQDACVSELQTHRFSYVVSDWGMGKDGFFSAICTRIGLQRNKVFLIDFSDFEAGEDFFEIFKSRLGGTFQQICEALADVGPCLLVLDGIDAGASDVIERQIRSIVDPLRDFVAEAYIILHSRRRLKSDGFHAIELKPLDEPDLAIYVRESELGGERYSRPDAVSKLFRHTDGVPSRIDDALRDLEIVSLDDLLLVNPDYVDVVVADTSAPMALVATIEELAKSENRSDERAYHLLLALSGLPQGEQLTRLKRFLGPHPFYPSHARELVERSLIDTVAITALKVEDSDDVQKALIVPRTVRDYVRSIIDDNTAKAFDRKMLDLYFGADWTTGRIDSSPLGKRVRKALCDGYEISNASALILRSMRRAATEDNSSDLERLIRLSSALIESLIEGDHFRAAASLCGDIIMIVNDFSEEHQKDLNYIRYQYVRSLRMTGRKEDAQREFEQLNLSQLTKAQQQSAELGLALILENSDPAAAADAARRVIALGKNSVSALQAQVIIAEQIKDVEKKKARLRSLLYNAVKNNYLVLASNIRLVLADEEDDEKAMKYLYDIVESNKKEGDFYNVVRAIIELGERQVKTSGLKDADRTKLIDAYHFLYNERLTVLFNKCHDVLWGEFTRLGQIDNLLNLFRHSSFIWRLNGQEETEKRYLSKLAKVVRIAKASNIVGASRDGSYFLVRVSVVMRVI